MIYEKNRKMRFGALMLAGAVAAGTLLVGCSQPQSGDGGACAVTVGGYPVSEEEYNYYFLRNKYYMDQGDNSYWNVTEEEETELKNYTEEELKESYAIKKLADDAGIPSDGEIAERVDADIDLLKEQNGGEEAFNQILASAFMSPELYRTLALEYERSVEYFKKTYGDQVKKEIADNYLRAAHILIAFNENAADTEADHEEKRQRAEDVLKKVEAGEDFFQLVAEYGEDPGMVDNLDGYYFTEGEMVEPFYEGAIALKEGETSGLVETNYGYHIIKRLPMEDEYLEENLLQFVSNEVNQEFLDKISETEETMEVTPGESYDNISLEKAIKENAE